MFGRDKNDVIETLPIVPLRDVVVFPHMMIPFVIGRQSSIRALEHALRPRQAHLPLRAARRHPRQPGPGGDLHPGHGVQHRAEPQAPRRQRQGAGGGPRPRPRPRVPRGAGPHEGRGQAGAPPRGAGHRDGRPDVEGHRPLRAVRQALEQPPLRRHARRGARGGPGQARRHHLVAPRGLGGGEAEPARDLLRRGAPHPDRLDPRGRGGQAQRGPPHPGPRQEADGARPEGVLPQREDEGDPEGAGAEGRPHQRGGRAAAEGRAGPDAEGRGGEGAPGAEAPRVHAPDVGGGHRLPQLPRLADRRPLDEEDPRAEGPRRRRADPERRPLRPREGQGADRRVPRGAAAGEQPEGPHPLLRGPPGGRQDLARPLDRPRHEPQVRAALPGRRARRGGDPGPPPHLHRCLPRPDHPDDEEGGRAQPRLPARRGGQDVHGLPGRPLGRPPRGPGPGAEPHLRRPLPRRRVRPLLGLLHRHRQRAAHHPPGPAGPPGGDPPPRLHRAGEDRDRAAPPHPQAGQVARPGGEERHLRRGRARGAGAPLHPRGGGAEHGARDVHHPAARWRARW